MPAPSLYGQFDNLDDIDYVLQGLLDYGFDDVYEVSRAAEMVSGYTRRYLRREGVRKPVISSACPVVVRLISLRFPFLCDNVMPLLPPMEIAGMLAREQAREMNPGLPGRGYRRLLHIPLPRQSQLCQKRVYGQEKLR